MAGNPDARHQPDAIPRIHRPLSAWQRYQRRRRSQRRRAGPPVTEMLAWYLLWVIGTSVRLQVVGVGRWLFKDPASAKTSQHSAIATAALPCAATQPAPTANSPRQPAGRRYRAVSYG